MTEHLLVYTLEDLTKEPFGFDISSLTKADWYQISFYSELSEEFIRTYNDKLDWNSLINAGCLNESLIRDFAYNFKLPYEWDRIAMHYGNLSPEFLKEFLDKFLPDTLLEYQKVSAKLLYKIIKKSSDPIGLAKKAIEYQRVTPQMLKAIEKADVPEAISWYDISKSSKLGLNSLNALKNDLRWDVMCKYRDLPESIIVEYKDYIDWEIASEYQNLSKEIILTYPKKINAERLKLNKKIDQKKLEEEEVYTMLALLQ